MNGKAHTGEHILFRALSTVFDGMIVKKVEFGKRNYFLVHYNKEIEWNGVLEAELIANRIISEGRPVTKVKLSREEAHKYPQLRVRWDRITDDTVTVVEVDGFDWAACKGNHVKSTKEVEFILVTRITSVGKGDYEIEFTVGDQAHEEALKRSVLAMEVSSLLRTSLDKVQPTIRNLLMSECSLKEAVQTLTRNVLERMTPDEVYGTSVYIEDVSGGDRKVIQRKAAEITGGTGRILVVFQDQSSSVLMVARSPTLSFDCRELVQFLLPHGKGGGKPEFAMGSSTEDVTLEDVKTKVKQFLEKSMQI